MKNRLIKHKRIWSKALSVITVVILMAAMTLTVFAQGSLQTENPASKSGQNEQVLPVAGQPHGSVAPEPEATEQPRETATPAPEATEQPQETATPALAPEPEPSTKENPEAEPGISSETTGGEEDRNSADTANDATGEAIEALEADQDKVQLFYEAPEIFLTEIIAFGSSDSLQLTAEQIEDLEKYLPAGLSAYRKEVVLKAYSLVGKVNYFWGGKSTEDGWDIRWGNQAIVGSAGSSQTGTVRSYGLDCSGYVLWCLLNAEESLAEQGVEKTDLINRIGYGTSGQWSNSHEISWEEAQPGDLLFYKNPTEEGINHVGIVVGAENEELLVAHCSSAQNNVVVTSASGFCHARRLNYIEERESEEIDTAKATEIETIPSGATGLPLVLTEEQAYRGAIQNGWTID